MEVLWQKGSRFRGNMELVMEESRVEDSEVYDVFHLNK